MEQFNTIPTSGNWSDIAGILDANFLRCYTALVQSESLVGLSGSNFQGIYTSSSALPDDMTEAGWALVGTSLSALKLYVFNEGATDWALYSNDTYDFTDYSGLVSQLATISSNLGNLANLQTTDKSSAVAAINEVKNNAGGTYNLITNNHSSAMSLATALQHIPTDKYQVGLHIIFNESAVGVVEYQFTDATISNITNATYWEAIPHTETAGESLVTSTNNAPDADLDMMDEDGNVIARFYNGHIKTKYFDSSKVGEDINNSIIARLKDKHIAIVGDSISTFTGYIPSGWRNYYTTSNLSSVNNTYWIKLCNALGMTYNNCAYSNSRVSGNSLATAADVTGAANQCAGCSDVRIDALDRDGKTPDIILIELGTNDWGNNVAIGTFDDTSTLPAEGTISTFAPAYALMLYKMQVAYPNAQIFCCTILPRLSGDVDGLATPPCINSGGVSLNAYNNKIKEIANIFGCNVIDLFACGLNFVNIASYAVDSTLHPNAQGHTLMANKIIAELKAKY